MEKASGFLYYVSREGVTGGEEGLGRRPDREGGDHSKVYRFAGSGGFWHLLGFASPFRWRSGGRGGGRKLLG